MSSAIPQGAFVRVPICSTVSFTVLLAMSSMTWAQRASVTADNIDMSEVGMASALGSLLCGQPPSAIDRMNAGLERLSPGATRSTAYLNGVAQANALLQEVRSTSPYDDSELRAIKCPTVSLLVTQLGS